MSAQPAEEQVEDSTLDAEISSLIADLLDEHGRDNADERKRRARMPAWRQMLWRQARWAVIAGAWVAAGYLIGRAFNIF